MPIVEVQLFFHSNYINKSITLVDTISGYRIVKCEVLTVRYAKIERRDMRITLKERLG